MSDSIIELQTIALENENNGNLQNIFSKINDNFQALILSEYARGEKGNGFKTEVVPFVNDGVVTEMGRAFADAIFKPYLTDKGEFFFRNMEDKTLNGFKATVKEVLGNDYGLDEIIEYFRTQSVVCLVSDTLTDENELDVILSNVSYFVDPRIAVITGSENDSKKSTALLNFIDLSGIFWVEKVDPEVYSSEITFIVKKSNNLPTLQYKNGSYYWYYNGSTGIPATGPKGADGDGGKIFSFIGYREGDTSLEKENQTYITCTHYYSESTMCYEKFESQFSFPNGSLGCVFEVINPLTEQTVTDCKFLDLWVGPISKQDGKISVRCCDNNSFTKMSVLNDHTEIFKSIGKGSIPGKSYMPNLFWTSQFAHAKGASADPLTAGAYEFLEQSDGFLNFHATGDKSLKNLFLGFTKVMLPGQVSFETNSINCAATNVNFYNTTITNGSGSYYGKEIYEDLTPSQIKSISNSNRKIVVTEEYLEERLQQISGNLNMSMLDFICPIGTIQAVFNSQWKWEKIKSDISPVPDVYAYTVPGTSITWVKCTFDNNNIPNKTVNSVIVPNMNGRVLTGEGDYYQGNEKFQFKLNNGYNDLSGSYVLPDGTNADGEVQHKLTTKEMPKHGHWSTLSTIFPNFVPWVGTAQIGTKGTDDSVQANGNRKGYYGTTPFTALDKTGNDEMHNNMQPIRVVEFMIRVR